MDGIERMEASRVCVGDRAVNATGRSTRVTKIEDLGGLLRFSFECAAAPAVLLTPTRIVRVVRAS